MSAVPKASTARAFQAALQRWPKDTLRPDLQLQDVLAKRLTKGPIAPVPIKGLTQEQADLRQANALFSLTENRYKNKYRVTDSFLKPKFNPNYYSDILKELDEAPRRSYFQRLAKKFQGMFRLE
ncbi:hypothetical protein QBC40DRAFT_202718 [Triangularia verruculosa]|uniref:Uncharacterized protein n=1 Tax=Triangularia verruculosa TaxID=2587418 RepID=A0AAN6XG50_9PEZI|nr:hypothetical protein QBC40DRAFT_202718 [Triangularia verruculosa]